MNNAIPDRTAEEPPPRTPFIRPDRFFAEREFNGLRLLVVVSVLIFSAPMTIYGAGWVITAHIDGTILVDNPDRPPDWFCDDDHDSQFHDESACEQPRQVERDVDAVIWPVMHRFVGPAMGGILLVWLLIGLVLHAGSWLAGGTGGAMSSFAVAAWGIVPELAGTVVGLIALYLWMDPITVTPGADPATAVESALRQMQAVRPFLTAVTLGTTAWSGVIWRYGLEHKRDVAGTEAWLLAALVVGLIAIFAIL